MALLSADEVHNKKFRGTKFRDGYDPDEVDDFLDEIVTTLSAHESTLGTLERENEELKTKLAAAERRIAELSSGAAVATSPAEAPQPAAEVQPAEAEDTARFAPPAEEPQHAAVPASEPEAATKVIQLAQQLHDQLVQQGREDAEQIVGDAQQKAEKLVRDAEETHNRTLAQLEQERSVLERKIDELRVFERDYRTRLKSYLESLLHEVEGRAAISGGRRSESDAELR